MLQFSESLCLDSKSIQKVPIVGLHQLHGESPMQTNMQRFVHDAHPPGTQNLIESISPTDDPAARQPLPQLATILRTHFLDIILTQATAGTFFHVVNIPFNQLSTSKGAV